MGRSSPVYMVTNSWTGNTVPPVGDANERLSDQLETSCMTGRHTQGGSRLVGWYSGLVASVRVSKVGRFAARLRRGGSAQGRLSRARPDRIAHALSGWPNRQPCRASTSSSASTGQLATSTPIRFALHPWSRLRQLPCRPGHVQHRTSTPTTSSLPTPSMNSISNDSQREVAISKSL